MRSRLTLVLFLAGVFVSATAEAASITFNFTGTATASFVGGISTPAPLTGSYTLDFPAVDTNADPERGRYAITGFSISVGGYEATGSAGTVTVQSDAGGDLYHVSLPVTTSLGGFAPLTPFEFALGGDPHTALSSDALPTSINVAAFDNVNFFFVRYLSSCGAGCNAAGIFGNISSVTVATSPVPEPGTFVLIGAGIAMALARCRRKR